MTKRSPRVLEAFHRFFKNYEESQFEEKRRALSQSIQARFGLYSGKLKQTSPKVLFERMDDLANKNQQKIQWQIFLTSFELEAGVPGDLLDQWENNPKEIQNWIWNASKKSLLKAAQFLKPNHIQVNEDQYSISLRRYDLGSFENEPMQSFSLSMKYSAQKGLHIIVSVQVPKKLVLETTLQDHIPTLLENFITTLAKTFSCHEVHALSAWYKDESDPSLKPAQAA
jgi:hypothetical protein